ncbi:MAG: PAS domain S-box protein [Blastocatellia bacterium]|nr:PAS domain S-box protein [Blastocatellia bacterium]
MKHDPHSSHADSSSAVTFPEMPSPPAFEPSPVYWGCSLDLAGTVTSWPPAAERMMGHSAAEILGRLYTSCLVFPDVVPGKTHHILETVIANGCYKNIGWQARKEGGALWAEVTVFPVFDGTGQPAGFSLLVRDLTTHLMQGLTSQEPDRFLLEVINMAMDGVIVVDENHCITLYNKASERMFQCPVAEALGQPLNRFIPERYRAAHTRHIEEFAQSEPDSPLTRRKIRIVWGVRANGEEFPLEAWISKIEVEEKKRFTVVHRDISERLQAETRLQKSQELNQAVLDSLDANIAVLDRNGIIIAVNRAWMGFGEKNGLDPEQAAVWVGTSYFGWTQENEVHSSADFDVSVAVAGIQSVLTGEAAHFSCEYPCHSLTEERWFLLNVTPLNRQDGGAVVAHIDITAQKEMELALRKSEGKLNEAQRLAHLGSWEVDLRSNTTSWSEGLHQLLRRDSALGVPDTEEFWQMVHPADRDAARQEYEVFLQTGTPLHHTFRLAGQDESIRWIEARAKADRDVTGQLIYIRGTNQDITQQQLAVTALERSEERFRALVEQAADAFFIHDLDGQFLDVNRQTCESLGYSREELLHMVVTDVEQNFSLAEAKEVWKNLKPNQPITVQGRLQRKDGSSFSAEVRVNRLQWQGQLLVMGLVRDITERVLAETSLRESEERYRRLVEVSPDTIFINRDNKIAFINQSGLNLLGAARPEDILGKSPFEIFHPDDHTLIRNRVGRLLKTREAAPLIEERIVRLDGTVVPVEVVAAPIESDGILAIQVVLRNITERKRAERRIATQNAISRVLSTSDSLLEAAPALIQALCESEGWEFGAIWEYDRNAKVLHPIGIWHLPETKFESLVRKTRHITIPEGAVLPGKIRALEKPLEFSLADVDQEWVRGQEAQAAGLHHAFGFPVWVSGEVGLVLEFFTGQRENLSVELHELIAAISSQIGQFVERKRAQDEVGRFLAFSPVVLYTLKLQNGVLHPTWTSKNVYDLTGFTPSETNVTGWWEQHLHPDDEKRVSESLPNLYELGNTVQEYRFRHKDGSYFWVRDEKRLVADAVGAPVGIVGSWSNITERIHLEEQFRQAQKMEAIGRLAGGVAHDFNNLLTAIIGYCDLLLFKMPADDRNRRYLADIRSAGDHAANLTRQLLAFSRKQILEPKVVDINDSIARIERMLQRLIGEDISFSSALDPAVSRVKVDPGQLEQVIINLAVNARDAMPQGGRLTIGTHDVEVDADYCRIHSDIRPGRYTMLTISDTGIGMTPEVKANVFEPFFTTKEPGKGTGLGLATVFGIIKQSEGSIEVESQVGVGTCFKIYLPALEERLSFPISDGEEPLVVPGSETILLVEDEAVVRRIAKLTLESFAYRVLEAENGRQALQVVERHNGPIDLLVTDVVMPEMNGRKLAEILKDRIPQLKVLYMSGYTDDAVVRHGIIESNIEFLQKPFSPRTLAHKVRGMLDERRN